MNTTTEQSDKIRDDFQHALEDLKDKVAALKAELDGWSDRVDRFAEASHV